MTESVRFCIRCGRQIDESPYCTNPECGQIPNFYRMVPGPERLDDSGAVRKRQGRSPPGRHPRPGVSTQPLSVGPDDARRTVALPGTPVALLETTSPPRVQHMVFPGALGVGARAPAEIVIERPEVSSRHARIVCELAEAEGFTVTVEDCGSTNGTFVNGKRIQREQLRDGDRIRFANVEFVLRFLATTEPRVTIAM